MILKNLIKLFALTGIVGILFITESCKKLPGSPASVIEVEEEMEKVTTPPEPIAFKVGSEDFPISKFSTLSNRYIINDSTDLKSLTKEIVFQQLLFKEAKEKGYDQNPLIINELKTYKNIIYDDYQQDSTLISELSLEAYQHLQNEVEVSHILIYCSEYAEAQTKSQKKEVANEIYERITSGESFEELAKQFSDDKSTASAGGHMGWYTGLQLLYPLEATAYKLNIGEVSKPIVSKYGFHIVKLLNKRASRGRVKVEQLLRVVPDNNEVMAASQKKVIDSLRVLIQNGANFEKLVAEYSDDFRTRDNGGLLPEFWIGSRQENTVEEAVFKLQLNELSEPVKSSAGWHLFKLVEKNPIPEWEFLKEEIAKKVATDSRGEFIEKKWLEDAKVGLGFQQNKSVVQGILGLESTDLSKGIWRRPQNDEFNNSFLFSIKGESISVQKFYDYVELMQQGGGLSKGFSAKMAMRFFYNRFEKKEIENYAKDNLELVNQNFKKELDAYKESLVTKNYLNDVVYNKSLIDSSGLKNFYRKTLQNYQLPERAKVVELVSKSQNAIRFIEEQLIAGKPYNLKRGLRPTLFDKNSSIINDEEKLKLRKLVIFMRRNPNYIVEIGGHSDVNEDAHVSSERIQTITKFLISNGLSITRIKENDAGKSQPEDRFDWQKNQRITYRFFSNSIMDLERVLENQGFEIEIVNDIFSKEEIVSETGIEWKVGSYSRLLDEGFQQKIIIEEIYPARTKSFSEAKSQVINGYQVELENKLYETLTRKYPVEINEILVESILKNKSKIN